MKSKKSLICVLISLMLFLTIWRAQNLNYPPLFRYIESAFYVLLIGFMGYWAIRVLKGEYRPSVPEWFLLLVMLIPAVSALLAFLNFGQPVLYGLLAERRWGKAAAVVLLIFMYRKRYYQLDDLKKVLLTMAVICLVSYYGIALFLDPVPYVTGFSTWSTSKGYMFRLNPYIMVWGGFYFMFEWLERKRTGFLLLAVLFMDYLLFLNKGRALTLVFLLAFVALLVVTRKWKQWIPRLVPLVVVVGLLYFPLAYLFPGRVYNSLGDYPQLVESVVRFTKKDEELPKWKLPDSRNGGAEKSNRETKTGSRKNKPDRGKSGTESALKKHEQSKRQVLDRSSGLRVKQARKALRALNRSWSYWVFGHGYLSRQWQGGFSKHLRYFYMSDIGPLGVVFLYGMIGLFFLLVQVVIGLVYGWRLLGADLDGFDLSIMALWLFSAGSCVLGAYLAVFPGLSLLALGMIYIVYRVKVSCGCSFSGMTPESAEENQA